MSTILFTPRKRRNDPQTCFCGNPNEVLVRVVAISTASGPTRGAQRSHERRFCQNHAAQLFGELNEDLQKFGV